MENSEPVTKFDRVIESLLFCPTCGLRLELHPITGQPACFLHGDFEVTEVKDSVRVEFKAVRW